MTLKNLLNFKKQNFVLNSSTWQIPKQKKKNTTNYVINFNAV